MTPKLSKLGLVAFIQRAWRSKVRVPCLAFQVPGEIVVWSLAASPARLAHEWLHEVEPGLEHAAWYEFDVFSYNPIRLRDKHNALERSHAWRLEADSA